MSTSGHNGAVAGRLGLEPKWRRSCCCCCWCCCVGVVGVVIVVDIARHIVMFAVSGLIMAVVRGDIIVLVCVCVCLVRGVVIVMVTVTVKVSWFRSSSC